MPKRPSVDYIKQFHKPFFLKEGVAESPAELRKGQIVHLTYEGKERWVLIIDPNWENKIHVLDLKYFPRKALLKVINPALASLTPRQFYEQHIRKTWVSDYGAYRTYDRSKVSSFREITYNLDVQPGERGEPGIKEPKDKPEGISVNKQGEIIYERRP